MAKQRPCPAPGPQSAQIALKLDKVKNIEQLPMKYLDADAALSARSDERVPSQKAVKDYVDGREPFPVGAVFISVVATNPQTLLGYGTWSAFGAGKVLVGLDSGDTDFDTAEETGGAKSKTISAHAGTAVATHTDHTHDVTSNITTTPATVQSGAGATVVGSGANGTSTSTGASIPLAHTVTQPDAHADLNVVQPYIVCYFWKRVS